MKTKSQNKPNRRDAMHCVSKRYCHPELVEGLTFSRLQRRADTDNKLMPIFRQAQDDITFLTTFPPQTTPQHQIQTPNINTLAIIKQHQNLTHATQFHQKLKK